jgi:hypothetical protein
MPSIPWCIVIRLALILLAAPAMAAELELRFAALERILAEQVFTQDGRHYVRGNKSTRCQFAYLEKPHIDADGARLRVAARFSGRSAIDLLGGCVGLGDSFDLVMTATPVVRAGAIALKDVKVTTTRESYYIRKVRAALAQSISKDLKIEVHDQARKLVEQPGGTYQPELAAFDLSEIRITADALVLVVEFRMVVK